MQKNPPQIKEIRRDCLGPMQDLLLRACPINRNGEASIKILAARMRLSHLTIYAWIRKSEIPPNHIDHLIRLNNNFWDNIKKQGGTIIWERVVNELDFEPYYPKQGNATLLRGV